MRLITMLISGFVFAVLTWSALAAPRGSLKIFKQGEAADWADRDHWRSEIIIPAGAVFEDVGPIDGRLELTSGGSCEWLSLWEEEYPATRSAYRYRRGSPALLKIGVAFAERSLSSNT